MKLHLYMCVEGDDYSCEGYLIAAETHVQASLINIGAADYKSKDDYVAACVYNKSPESRKNTYKTDAGFRQALQQFNTCRRSDFEKCYASMYDYAAEGSKHIQDTGLMLKNQVVCLLGMTIMYFNY